MTETEEKKTKEEEARYPPEQAGPSVGEERKHRKDAEEVKEILGTLSTELPKMIKGIMDSVFSAEVGSRTGKAVADFYRNLKEAGIPEQEALAMTKEYLKSFTNWSEMLKGTRIPGFMKRSSEEKKSGEQDEE